MIFFVQQLKQEKERNPTFPKDNPAQVLPWTNPTLQKVHQGRNSWIPFLPSCHSWPALRQSLPQGKALDFLCTGAQSHLPAHGMASNPPFPVVQELLWAQGSLNMDTVAEKGNPREAEPPGPIRTVPVPLSSPCKGNRSSEASAASNVLQPLLSHKEFQCSFTSTSIQKGELKRDPVSSWLSTLDPPGASPACSSQGASCWQCHWGIGGKLVFLKKKHSNSLCFPKHRGSTVKPLFFSYFHRDVVLRGRVSSSSWSQGPLGLRGASFRKGTPKCRGSLKPLGQKDYRRHQRRQSNSISASSSFQKHIEKRIILGQSFKDSQVTFPESAGKEEKKRDSEEWGIILNHPLI